MASNCPECNTETHVDFGMAQCENCKSVFYVNIDGSVSVSDGAEEPQEVSEVVQQVSVSEPATFHSVEELHQNLSQSAYQEESAAQNGSSWNQWQGESNSVDEEPAWNSQSSVNPLEEFIEHPDVEEEVSVDYAEEEEKLDSEDENQFSVEDPVEEGEFYTEPASEFEEASASENGEDRFENIIPKEEPQAKSPKEQIAEIAEFGNSDISQARHGILYYDLYVVGIDTAEERKDLEDILSNRQLMISVEEQMRKITEGALTIEKLNPVKASVIVMELERTAMDVKWRQHAINE